MGYAILGLAAGICAFGWLNRYVCCAALLLHMQAKGTLPSSEEMKACLLEAWTMILHVKKDQTEI